MSTCRLDHPTFPISKESVTKLREQKAEQNFSTGKLWFAPAAHLWPGNLDARVSLDDSGSAVSGLQSCRIFLQNQNGVALSPATFPTWELGQDRPIELKF